ncbi:MAG: cohesin domain-containing protein [Patescibacteria group bacterium]
MPLAQAATFEFEPSRAEMGVGEVLRLEVRMDSPENVNAVQGRVEFPKDILEVKRISEGASIINLWIVHPRVTDGKIEFSGAIPGGYPAFDGVLFTIDFLAKKPGNAKISIQNALALLNDGEGTEASLIRREAVIKVTSEPQNLPDPEEPDEILPEIFSVTLIDGGELIGEGKFAVFSTQDKGSGLSHYEVFEGRSFIFRPDPKEWQVAGSPYLLMDQDQKSWLAVKAIDNQGNERVVWIAPPGYALRLILLTIPSIFILALVLLLRIRAKHSRDTNKH